MRLNASAKIPIFISSLNWLGSHQIQRIISFELVRALCTLEYALMKWCHTHTHKTESWCVERFFFHWPTSSFDIFLSLSRCLSLDFSIASSVCHSLKQFSGWVVFWDFSVSSFFMLYLPVVHQNINEIDHLKHCGLIPLYLLGFSIECMSIVYTDGRLSSNKRCATVVTAVCSYVYWNELTNGTAFRHKQKKKTKSNEQQIDESVNRYSNLLHGISNVLLKCSLSLPIAPDSFVYREHTHTQTQT